MLTKAGGSVQCSHSTSSPQSDSNMRAELERVREAKERPALQRIPGDARQETA